MNPAAWYTGALLLFSLHLGLGYFAGTLGEGLVATALLCVVVLLCTGMGRILLRIFGTHELSASEKTLIGCTLGLGVLTQGLFLLGALGLLKPWAVLALLAVLWVVGFTESRDVLVSLGANRNLLRERPLWTAGPILLLGAAFWAAWAPPHQYDSLVYHLPLASSYARTGGIAPLPHLLFSHFPQNAEMLFTLALLFKSDVLAQLFTWLAGLLSVLWVFEMGKREMPLPAALAACVLTASHTAVLLLASTTYVEPFVMLWVTAAVLCFCRWREVGGLNPAPGGWLALSAIFAGLGLGTKYYAGICPAVLGLMLCVRWIRIVLNSRGGIAAPAAWNPWPALAGLKDIAVFGAVSTAAASPWLVKNWIFVGNPVFPFLYNVLPHRRVAWEVESARRYFGFLTEYGHGGHFLSDLLHFPYLAASGSLRFGGGMDVLGDLGWGLLFALVPAGCVAATRNRTIRRLGAYCALHWIAWFSTGVVLRFLTVLVPLASLVAAAGLHRLWGGLGPKARAALVVALGVLAATNLALFSYVHSVFRTWSVLLGVETREEYLSKRLDYYPCARWAREHLGENDRILIVGEQRGYYVTQDHVVTTPMAPNPYVEWANRAEDPAGLARVLRAEGDFTHLLVVPREAKRLGEYGIFPFTERGWTNWAGLEAGSLKTLTAAGGCALYELR